MSVCASVANDGVYWWQLLLASQLGVARCLLQQGHREECIEQCTLVLSNAAQAAADELSVSASVYLCRGLVTHRKRITCHDNSRNISFLLLFKTDDKVRFHDAQHVAHGKGSQLMPDHYQLQAQLFSSNAELAVADLQQAKSRGVEVEPHLTHAREMAKTRQRQVITPPAPVEIERAGKYLLPR